ncbi:hypothetical protein HPC62_03695 [Thermoleptolyngbya sichuanensis A183]|uniref:Uncharacterized protein n=1 Tax=Thermoleptolyngbya sichuanensis A183 TaxID=2737172 RepID=A0A6M8BA86_9CYAN|nr:MULTISPECIES: hypothetical protein [Thermoleptolyngbya]QKD81400.1 hypothetical protein HPC62_03695 [Thermoleptolyngbya sichuanensis A183]
MVGLEDARCCLQDSEVGAIAQRCRDLQNQGDRPDPDRPAPDRPDPDRPDRRCRIGK